MFNSSLNNSQSNTGFRKLQGQQTDATSSDLSNLGFAQEMMQVINSQHILIAKLLQKQNALYQEFRQKFSSSGSSSGSVDNPSGHVQMAGYRPLIPQDISGSGSPIDGSGEENWNKRKVAQGKNMVRDHGQGKRQFIEDNGNSDEEDDESSQMMLTNHRKRKQTETKNMVKNFAKSIFGYIAQNRDKRVKVLNRLGICQQDFMKMINGLKGKVHSISELRALWTPEGNIYHQVFRMFSCQYLRKHCLQRTFHSRVQNFMIHLKYRERLLDGLRSPQDFTALKTN